MHLKFEPSISINFYQDFLVQNEPTNAILDPSGETVGEDSVPSLDVNSIKFKLNKKTKSRGLIDLGILHLPFDNTN